MEKYTLQQAAKYLLISPERLRYLANNNQIPSFTKNFRRYILKQDLHNFIKKQKACYELLLQDISPILLSKVIKRSIVTIDGWISKKYLILKNGLITKESIYSFIIQSGMAHEMEKFASIQPPEILDFQTIETLKHISLKDFIKNKPITYTQALQDYAKGMLPNAYRNSQTGEIFVIDYCGEIDSETLRQYGSSKSSNGLGCEN